MPADRRPITRLIGERVRAIPGAQSRIAFQLGLPESTVCHWFSETSERHYSMPVDALPVVAAEVGIEIYGPIVAQNGLDQPHPRRRPTSNPGSLARALITIMAELGDVSDELEAAGTDVSDDEGEGIYQEAEQLRAAVDAFMARCPRKASR